MYDVLIVGAGFAGSVVARELALQNKKVLLIDEREHFGGNAYDYFKDDILIHKYGPHIFHTSSKVVYDYLSQFTNWYPYEHKVLGHIKGKLVPIPFNYASIDALFTKDKAERLRQKLSKTFKDVRRLTISELSKQSEPELKELADFIFENVFKHYTAKQWGLNANEIDPSVMARVPVKLSYKDGYFDDLYQVMPSEGYSHIFKQLLDSPNIKIRLRTKASSVLKIEAGKIYVDQKEFRGQIVYSGMIDELFEYILGELPYRSLDLVLERKEGTFQQVATENYPGPQEKYPFTRISEYKHFMVNEPKDYTYIHSEYPLPYKRNALKGNIPYYPIFTQENQHLYQQYLSLASNLPQITLVGRLAEYKYYNMDAIILRALKVSHDLLNK